MNGDVGSRLKSVFSANAAQASAGNDPLRYQAPREPSRGSQSHVQPAQAQPTQQQQQAAASNTVVFHTSVSLYQYDGSARKYVQMTTPASNAVGCVLVGAEVTYSVLFYNADKTPLCEVPLKAWKPTVQPKNYMNFYDEKATNWSVKFASEDALVEFMRQVFLVKIHVEIWSPMRSLDANSLLKEELGAAAIKNSKESDASATPVSQGDRVAVAFKCWRVVGNAKAQPNDIVIKYPPFEKAENREDDLRKFRVGDGGERIKALEEGVVGMKRGNRRMILAPPGKTNGQDWYLIDVTLVKTRSKDKRGSANGTTAAAAAPADPPASEPAAEPRKSRRKPSGSSSSSRDIVARDEDPAVAIANAKAELELEELRLLLESKKKAFAEGGNFNAAAANGGFPQQTAMPQQSQYSQMFGSAQHMGGGGGFSSYNGMYTPPAQQGMMMASGRPVDGMIMELHAKIDYLIRMAPSNGSGSGGASSYGGPVGVTDVQSVLRGVERLAGENERLLLQINSQNQQYTSYEKRCEELLKHNQRLQDEKRVADEKYQSMASLQMNYNAEISSLTSARDAAITQTNRLHAEYQQLLNAFYQKQQVSTESEEQKNALEFERQARVRLEKDLQKETQTRSLVEQELTLVKKQLEVFSKMKDSEVQSHRQEMEKQLHAVRASQQSEIEDRVKKVTTEYQQQEKRLQQEWQAQLDRQSNQLQTQIEALQSQMSTATSERQQALADLDSTWARIRELEATASASIASETMVGLADEEKRIYQDQIELLQQQVKDLEAENFARVQQDLDSGRLGSPASSPRNRKKLDIADDEASAAIERAEQLMAAAKAKEEAADRTLGMAQEIKRETEMMMMSSENGHGGDQSVSAREKTVSLFKEAINEIFFRFQDVFEDESYAAASLEGKQVLGVIRKVLKQTTKDVVHRLQQEEPSSAEPVIAAPAALPAAAAPSKAPMPVPAAIGAATVATAVAVGAVGAVAAADDAGADSEASNDEPPPPPELEEVQATKQAEKKESKLESKTEVPKSFVEEPKKQDAKEEGDNSEEDEDDDVVSDDLLFGAASSKAATTYPIAGLPSRKAEDSEDSEDDFED